MTAAIPSSLQQNFSSDKKSVDPVEKDIRKWVDSVVEFKANLDKKKNEPPLEKHLKKVKKFKMKRKGSLQAINTTTLKSSVSGQQKHIQKPKKAAKITPKPEKKSSVDAVDSFELIKESYRTLKLPHNWTSGVTSGRVVFNRIKITTQNSQQKMLVERSLVITKDRNVHVLINGAEIILGNWEMQKIENIDDIKKAIKDIDALKLCGGVNGQKSSQCTVLVDNKMKMCTACKSEVTTPPKVETKKSLPKKPGIPKQKDVSKKPVQKNPE